MKCAITISLVPQAKGGPFVFWDGLTDSCHKAAALGFDGVEIFPPAANGVDRSELTQLLARTHLQVAAVGTGGGWVVQRLSLTHADVSIRTKARTFIREMIDLAASFGAPTIIGSMQGRWEGTVSQGQAVAWLGEALDDLGSHAAAHGQMLLLEPLNRYETNLFNHLTGTARFLSTLKTHNIKILADLFHMNIEEASIPVALREAAPWLGHIHFADSNRQAIGLGHTDVQPIFQVLRELGYQGYLSGEVLPLPDSETAARQTIRSFRDFTV